MFRDIDYSQSSSSDDYSTASDLTSDLDHNESDYNSPNIILNQYVQVQNKQTKLKLISRLGCSIIMDRFGGADYHSEFCQFRKKNHLRLTAARQSNHTRSMLYGDGIDCSSEM